MGKTRGMGHLAEVRARRRAHEEEYATRRQICSECGEEPEASAFCPVHVTADLVFADNTHNELAERWIRLSSLAKAGMLSGVVKSRNTLKTMRDLVTANSIYHGTIGGRGHFFFELSDKGKRVVEFAKSKKLKGT